MKNSTKELYLLFANNYQKTGINEFEIELYLSVNNHSEAIQELKDLGLINEKPNILQTLYFTDEALGDIKH